MCLLLDIDVKASTSSKEEPGYIHGGPYHLPVFVPDSAIVKDSVSHFLLLPNSVVIGETGSVIASKHFEYFDPRKFA